MENDNLAVNNEADDEYYLLEEEVEVKKPSKEDKEEKRLELEILKEKNQATKLYNESKRLQMESEDLRAKRSFEEHKLELEMDIEKKKIAVSERQNEIAVQQIEADTKKSKKENIITIIKATVGLIGIGVSTYIGFKKHREGMIFEETNSWHTATGKDAEKGVEDNCKDMKNLDKRLF